MIKDIEIIQFANRVRDDILNGNTSHTYCYLISSPLQERLRSIGIDTVMINISLLTPSIYTSHVYLQLEDGRILDATADQFPEAELPPVYLGEFPETYKKWMEASMELA